MIRKFELKVIQICNQNSYIISIFVAVQFNTFINLKMKIFVKLLIVRYHFVIIALLKPHLVCTFFNK